MTEELLTQASKIDWEIRELQDLQSRIKDCPDDQAISIIMNNRFLGRWKPEESLLKTMRNQFESDLSNRIIDLKAQFYQL
jgi:hypothetical protein